MVTPYDPDAWDSMLARFNLTIGFPTLSTSMRRGFSVGNPPPFLSSFTPQNHPSALANPGVIDNYILDELSSSRISGPYSTHVVEHILGHFYSCPLGLVPKSGESGKWRIIRDLSKKDTHGISVNDRLDPDDFPTEWGSARVMEQMVSGLQAFLSFSARWAVRCTFISCPLGRALHVLFVPAGLRAAHVSVMPAGLRAAPFSWPAGLRAAHVSVMPAGLRAAPFSLPAGPRAALFVRRNAPHWLHDTYAYRSGPMLQVAEAPEGAQGASSDVAKAYRTIPILPEHKRLIVFRHRDGFYIDHTLPFGLSTAAGMHGHVADATVALLRANGMPTIKWVDDKSHRRDPTSRNSDGTFNYAFDLDDIHQFLAPLRIPWQLDKCEQFSDTTRFVGFEWDYRRKRVTLPESKRQKHLAKVLDFLSHRQVSLGQVESLAGSLLHISFVARAGRSYLPALHAFATQFVNPHAVRYPPPRVTNDVRWWQATLELPDISRSILAPGPALDPGIWVDASEEFGIGIVIGDCYDAWQTRLGWKKDGRDIGWLETLALEFALRAAAEHGLQDAMLVIRGDNTGARGALLKGRGRNVHTNYAIRRIELVQQLHNLEVCPVWVESAANLADGVSRGVFPLHLSRYCCSFAMPLELEEFLEHV